MNEQHFWNEIYAWSLVLGFILTVIVIVVVAVGVDAGKLRNPFAPFIRAFERWQVHHLQMCRLKLRAELTRKGLDPDYVRFLEEKEK